MYHIQISSFLVDHFLYNLTGSPLLITLSLVMNVQSSDDCNYALILLTCLSKYSVKGFDLQVLLSTLWHRLLASLA